MFTQDELKGILNLISRVNNIGGAEVEAVKYIKDKIRSQIKAEEPTKTEPPKEKDGSTGPSK